MPDCIASTLNDCSSRISGEHPIPKSILDAGSAEKTVTLQGLHFLRAGPRKIAKASATAKVTCERHNNIASPLDAAFKQFFEALRSARSSRSPRASFTLCSGPDIERALLRFALITCAAKWNRDGSNAASLETPPWLLDLVWRNQTPPGDFGGLHVVELRDRPPEVAQMALAWDLWTSRTREFIALAVWIAGLSFALSAFPLPRHGAEHAPYSAAWRRPKELQFPATAGVTAIRLCWPTEWVGEHEALSLGSIEAWQRT